MAALLSSRSIKTRELEPSARTEALDWTPRRSFVLGGRTLLLYVVVSARFYADCAGVCAPGQLQQLARATRPDQSLRPQRCLSLEGRPLPLPFLGVLAQMQTHRLGTMALGVLQVAASSADCDDWYYHRDKQPEQAKRPTWAGVGGLAHSPGPEAVPRIFPAACPGRFGMELRICDSTTEQLCNSATIETGVATAFP